MQGFQLSGSKAPLAVLCPASVLPCPFPVNKRTPEGDTGSAVHEGLASRQTDKWKEPQELARKWNVDPGEVDDLIGWGWDMWNKDLHPLFPVPNVEEPQELSVALGRKLTGKPDLYSVIREAPPGSLFGGEQVSEVRVLDWKTSRSADEGAHIEQLLAYCYLLSRRYPTAQRFYAVVAWIRQGVWDPYLFDKSQLEAWWSGLIRHLERQPVRYAPGHHCRFCERALTCEARTAEGCQLITEFTPLAEKEALQKLSLSLPADPSARGEVLAQLHARKKQVQLAVDAVDELIRTEVELAGGSLPAGAGLELRLVPQEVRKIQAEAAFPILREEIGDKALISCCDIRKGRVEKILKDSQPPRQKKATVDRVLSRLEQADALRVDVQHRLEVVKLPILESTHERPATGPATTD